jgi:hypothetical protein
MISTRAVRGAPDAVVGLLDQECASKPFPFCLAANLVYL